VVTTFKSKIRPWKTVKAVHEERVLVGSYAYTEANQIVEVRSIIGERKARRLVGSTPEALARLMLIELADEGNA
jgi:hypothetical protein